MHKKWIKCHSFHIYKNANRILSKKAKSEEGKNKKRKMTRERYHNISEEEKEKRREYDHERQKIFLKMENKE